MTNCMLSINLNAVAHLRNRREVGWPNVVEYGKKILEAGAKGLTIHPRPDQRHIRANDVPALKKIFEHKHFDKAEYNIEGYPDQRFMDLVLENHPHQVTFVPDSPEQSTSDHGWDFDEYSEMLKDIIKDAKTNQIRTAVFINPTPLSAEKAAKTGADRIEIYTGPFGAIYPPKKAITQARLIADTSKTARINGLGVNAGHDLTLENIPILIEQGAEFDEVSIGHGFWSDAWLYGINETTRKYLFAVAGL